MLVLMRGVALGVLDSFRFDLFTLWQTESEKKLKGLLIPRRQGCAKMVLWKVTL